MILYLLLPICAVSGVPKFGLCARKMKGSRTLKRWLFESLRPSLGQKPFFQEAEFRQG